ncbi:hypothetical protein [Okeania sp. SIO1I7]|uniref:hypothetical protein n=1 Tax=Okeania sp. SIO1I7 TaxID=2607772 RepID=UPI0013FA6FAC|nr:hypothetical protein [Okeania sp. SIO1I7]NET25525.1 hypothetical protein [Okeania sp. SIO1I7]
MILQLSNNEYKQNTFSLIISQLMLIILIFTSPLLPYSPTQESVEKLLRNGISPPILGDLGGLDVANGTFQTISEAGG